MTSGDEASVPMPRALASDLVLTLLSNYAHRYVTPSALQVSMRPANRLNPVTVIKRVDSARRARYSVCARR